MANIKVELSHEIIDGQPVTFVAPCNCTAIIGLKVYHPGGSKEFTFKDTHGNDLTGIGNLFTKGAYVKAVLDTNNGFAYIQNADTNAYLEGKFKAIEGWTINGKALSSDVELSAADVGARPNTWLPTAEEIGAKPADWMPTAEQVGAKPADWMPTAEQVGARPADWMPTAEEVGARSADWMPTAADVGARPNTWTPTASQVGALPTSGGTMTGTVTLKGIKLTSGVDYGDTLPTAGTAGRIFFKKVSS